MNLEGHLRSVQNVTFSFGKMLISQTLPKQDKIPSDMLLCNSSNAISLNI